jgi:hypothetical protein
MTLQLLHSEFPYIRGKFDFLFFQCRLCLIHAGILLFSITRIIVTLMPWKFFSWSQRDEAGGGGAGEAAWVTFTVNTLGRTILYGNKIILGTGSSASVLYKHQTGQKIIPKR